MIDLFFTAALQKDGEGRGEGEVMLDMAVDAHELLTLDREGGRHDGPFFTGAISSVALYACDFRVFNEGRIEPHGLFGIGILEHKEWGGFFHGYPPRGLSLKSIAILA